MTKQAQINQALHEWQEKSLALLRERGTRLGVKNAKVVAIKYEQQKAFNNMMRLLTSDEQKSK